MGQVSTPQTTPSIILTATDRLVAINANGGMSPAAAHIILFGENAGHNLGPLSNIIGLGFNAFSAGITDPALSGTVVIGGNAYKGALDTTISGIAEASVIIGNNAMSLAANGAGANVVIGANAVAQGVGGGGSNYSSNLVMGAQAAQRVLFQNGSPFNANVIMGFRAARGLGAGAQSMIGSIVIGRGACENFPANLNNNVVIGDSAAPILSGDINVYIGSSAGGTAAGGTENVAVGAFANVSSGGTNSIFGARSGVGTGSDNTLLGARIAAILAGNNNVIIGSRAGVFTGLTDISDQFYLETVGNALAYGKFNRGYLMLGSRAGVQADRAALAAINPTNVLFLSDGTRGAGAPTNGGFLESIAGDLRWVASTGDERVVTGVFTVATLPGFANRAGSRAFVTDALAPAFGVAVAGGGAVFTPVYCDGAGWFVG